jgi:hypothetical protein
MIMTAHAQHPGDFDLTFGGTGILTGGVLIQPFGIGNDKPLPAAFLAGKLK